jgi:DNA-binding LacI/PurR family transcriptional regulator
VVTMRDVAKAAGVSQASVSYAYSGSPRVSPGLREQIFAIAAELGYTGPNIAGSFLRLGRIGSVGVLVPGSLALAVEDPSTMLLMKGIVEVSELSDVALTLLSVDGLGDDVRPTKPAALRGLVDGVVMHCLPNDHPVVAAMIARGVPAVAIDSPRLPKIPYVTVDHREGGFLQMNHVLALGHKRIGIITDQFGPTSAPGFRSHADAKAATETYLRERLMGYFEACAAAKNVRERDIVLVETAGIDMRSGIAAAVALIETDPTAIVATSDVHAAAAIRALADRGIRVPDDVSVIGFDDAPIADLIGLTTVRQPLEDKGRTAATMLLDLINGHSRRRSVKKVDLIVRSSTAAAPK